MSVLEANSQPTPFCLKVCLDSATGLASISKPVQ